MNRTPATIADLQPNAWLWATIWTAFNSEGLTNCPARVETIDDEKVTIRLFGKGDDTERNEVVGLPLAIIRKGNRLFLPEQGEVAAHIAREKEWAESNGSATKDYIAQLELA